MSTIDPEYWILAHFWYKFIMYKSDQHQRFEMLTHCESLWPTLEQDQIMSDYVAYLLATQSATIQCTK